MAKEGHQIYEPLDAEKQEIRLLEISPAAEQGAVAQVTLFKIPLKDAVSAGFVPLSYAWGAASDTTSIIVDGCPRTVRRSLAAFLQHIRDYFLPSIRSDPSVYNGKSLFWADALCIDQDNVSERGQQIAFMKDIYSASSVCLTWLGLCEDASLAAELCNTISAEWDAKVREAAVGSTFEYFGSDPNFGDWMSKHPAFWMKDRDVGLHNRFWNAVQQILMAPYWHRLWTYQEVVLPKYNFLMAGGSSVIDLTTLMKLSQWLSAVLASPRNRFPMLDLTVLRCLQSNALLNLRPIYRIWYAKMSETTGDGNDLGLVCFCQDLNATDPRDKIFGILALMDTQTNADYSKPVQQVYQEFCTRWWDEINTLDFLVCAGFSRRWDSHDLVLPSWVPDWRDWPPNQQKPMAMFMWSNTWSASRALSTDGLLISTSPCEVLSVRAVLCDQVEAIVPRWPDSYHPFFYAVFEWMADFMSTSSSAPLKRRTHILRSVFFTAFLGLNILDDNSHLNANVESTHTLFMSFLLLLLMPSRRLSGNTQESWSTVLQQQLPRLGLAPDADFARSYREKLFPDAANVAHLEAWTDATTAFRTTRDKHPGLSLQIIHSVRKALEQNVNFLTTSRDFGSAAGAEVGDIVAVLAGCKVPVILRKVNGKEYYQLVGTCYVHSLMEGQAVDEAGGQCGEIIEIR